MDIDGPNGAKWTYLVHFIASVSPFNSMSIWTTHTEGKQPILHMASNTSKDDDDIQSLAKEFSV
jgi:hypothetical protein